MSPQRDHSERGSAGGRSQPARWIGAPGRRSTGELLWESVSDIADAAAIWRWRPEGSPKRSGAFRPGRRRTAARVDPDTRRRRAGRFRAGPAGLRRWIQAGLVSPLLHASVRLDVGGLEELGRLDEPAILVANHASHLDTPAVLAALPAPQRSRTAIAVPGRSSIASGWRAAVSSLLFNAVRQPTPESRQQREEPFPGCDLLLFPEGTRSADGFPGPFESDAARLAIASHRPVMPVGIRGSYAAMPRGQSWPSPGRPRVAVRFGAPFRARSGEDAGELTDRTRLEVERLISEDITSWWQAQSGPRAGPPSEPPPGSWRRRWQQTRSAEPGKTPPRRKIWKY